MNIEKSLSEKLIAANYILPSSAITKIGDYLALLAQWNNAYNLTSVRDPQEMITRHILDSLAIRPYLSGKNILDVGTGAGLPGIPLALTEPDREFCLLDSNGKKTRFITQAVLTLQIPNVKIIQSRVEKFFPTNCFDSIVSRAFSSIADFIKLTKHLCCPEGYWLAMKGDYPNQELAEIREELATMVYDLQVQGLDAKRHLVVIQNKRP